MKNVITQINDLQTILKAINVVRQSLIQAIADKTEEIRIDHPEFRFSEVQDRAFASKEVMEILQKLNNLYGCLGEGSPEYITELDVIRDHLKKAG